MVGVPSPFQSPRTAVQPLAPKVNGGTVGAPALLLSRRNHVPVAGSNTAAVVGLAVTPPGPPPGLLTVPVDPPVWPGGTLCPVEPEPVVPVVVEPGPVEPEGDSSTFVTRM